MYTFKDVYNYIQQADRDDKGYHIIDSGKFPQWALHIYNGLLQVNLDKKDTPDSFFWTKGAMIFNPEENRVRLVRCRNSIANYDENNTISMDTEISDHLVVNYWIDAFGGISQDVAEDLVKEMQQLLIDLLGEWKHDRKYVKVPVDSIKMIQTGFNRMFDDLFGDVLRETNEIGEGPIYSFDSESGEISWK